MYTYTLLELESKTFGELKKIGSELNVLPEGDRRRRETWIDAIAGVNPPLLQLLEVSPAASVEQAQEPIIETVEPSPGVEAEPVQEAPLESKFGRIVYPRPVQEAIELAVENSPGAEPVAEFIDYSRPTQKAQEYRFLLCLKEGDDTLWYDGKDFVFERWSAKTYCKRGVASAKHQLRFHPEVKRAGSLQVVENSPGVEVDPVEDQQLPECVECFDDGFVEDESGVIKLCQCGSEPKLSRESVQSAIAPAAKNLPSSRSKTSTAHQLLELFKSSANIIEDSPGVKTEATVSGSAIAPAAKNHLDAVESEHPKSKAITFSDRFLARYSPPQPENIIFKSEHDGQLSLLDFEVQSQDEPPDPDDFESLDAFREAIARWDWEHPSSFDHHCSDPLPSSVQNEPSSVQNEPSSVQNEPPDPYEFDSMFAFWAAYDAWEASDDDSEPLEISLDSFCEWAPCPLDWYEPEVSEVSEVSAVAKSSITSEFFIPTFGRWGDRSDKGDEPPDTGIFARLPKPKPPHFPPQANPSQVNQASRNYPETIPKHVYCITYCIAASGSSRQSGRSPPGGDAM